MNRSSSVMGSVEAGGLGAAWATLISRTAILLAMILWLVRSKDLREWVPHRWFRTPEEDAARVRIIKLEPATHEEAFRSFHRDDNNRFNPAGTGWVVRSWIELTDDPDSYMLLMDNGPDGLPDPATEMRVPLHRGARFVVDTQRLWHVVVHNGNAPRYALITSFESGPVLEGWIESQLPVRV